MFATWSFGLKIDAECSYLNKTYNVIGFQLGEKRTINLLQNNSRLDPSQVQDRRGMSTGSKVALGGGGIGLVILVVFLLLGEIPGN